MEEKVQKEGRTDGDRFNRFMFGPDRVHQQHANKVQKRNKSTSPDINAILENVDVLMESAQNLKPLMNKVYPYVERLWKRK